jgi:hypothetical protein
MIRIGVPLVVIDKIKAVVAIDFISFGTHKVDVWGYCMAVVSVDDAIINRLHCSRHETEPLSPPSQAEPEASTFFFIFTKFIVIQSQDGVALWIMTSWRYVLQRDGT